MNDMTNMPCIDVESVAEILELSPGHPERRHAETCPRCRSLVDSYRSFIEAQDTDGSGIDDVRGALTAAVQKDAVAWSDRMPGQLWQRRVPRRRILRPLSLVAAALAVLVAAVWWTSRGPEVSVQREDTGASTTIVLDPARVRPDGSILLSWRPTPGADHYQARVYGPDLSELYRSANQTETSILVERTALPADLPPTLDLTWQVFAHAGNDLVATSPPGSIRIP